MLKFFRVQRRNFAGHAHWQNVLHKKTRNDLEKAKVNSKYGKQIRTAVKQGGSNRTNNFALDAIIKRAVKESVPKSVIDKALIIDKNEKSLEKVSYELSGPEGSMIIVDILTENRNKSLTDIRKFCAKLPLTIAPTGSLWFNFNRFGIISLNFTQETEDLLLDSISDIVKDFELNEETLSAKLYCEPNDVNKISLKLKNLDFSIEETVVSTIPKTCVTLSKNNWFLKFLSQADENEDIVDLSTNIIHDES